MEKARNPKYTTPRAIASAPHFNNPAEYRGAVRYKADLIMDREDAAPLIKLMADTLKKFAEKHNDALKYGHKKGKKINFKKAVMNLPIDDHEEDEKKVIISVKQSYIVNGKKVALTFYDAKCNLINKPPIIYNGSTVKVAGIIHPYDALGGGVTLSISAVQLIELTEIDANDFGFVEEEGYIHEGIP